MPEISEVVSTAISTEPASAVPSEAPRLVAVFCRPPTSPLSLGGHRRHGHAAELRGERADAEPDEDHRDGDHRRGGVDVDAGQQHEDAAEHQQEPDAHDAPRRARAGHTLGTPGGGHEQARPTAA